MSDQVREYVEQWLRDERAYTIDKFGLASDDQHTIEFYHGLPAPKPSWWDQQFDNYLGRAFTLGLDTPGGRQAAAKFVATAMGFLESVVRQFGPLPEPGVTSGENLNQLREV